MGKPRVTIAVFNEREEWSLPERYVVRVREAACDRAEVAQATTRGELLELLPTTSHMVGFQLTEEQVAERAGALEWVQLTHGGDSPSALRAVVERGGRVCHAARVRAPQVAEHAMALVLAMFRGLHISMSAQGEHRWAAGEVGSRVRSLADSTVGLVAFGPLGEEIARRLKGFGVTILATRKDPGNPFLHVDEMMAPDQLNEMLSRSDAVVVAAPRLAMTVGMIGKKQLSSMRDDAFLVNVSRGGVVDEAALLEALRRGRIAGAAMDAFDAEPLPPRSPFWTMPNVLVTPHVSSASPSYWERATELVCTNVGRVLSGQALVDEVPRSWLTGAG